MNLSSTSFAENVFIETIKSAATFLGGGLLGLILAGHVPLASQNP